MGATDKPLVSIVTPVLNGLKYLEECIQSVLGQSYQNIEHIFVDGGSTDGTLETLMHYAKQHPQRIRLITGRDAGIGDAVNKGYKTAKGEIFSWLDSDDIFEPDAVEYVVKFFKEHPESYFIFGGCDIINEKGEVIGTRPVKDFDFKEAVNDRHYIYLPAVFFTREAYEQAGPFNTLGNDLDFYIRAGKLFQLYRTGKTLAKYRIHKSRLSDLQEVHAVEINRKRFREDYLLCRRYGGNIFAPRCRRYFVFLMLDKLGLYHLISSSVLPRLRSHSFMNKVLKLLGA